MDGRDGSMCSQTFFVSQRSRNNKLSLSQSIVNRSKNAVKSKCAKSAGKGKLGSASKLRHGGVQSHIPTMEKYLDRGFKEAKSTTREATCDESKRVNAVYDDSTSKQIDFRTRKSPLDDICAPKVTEAELSMSSTVTGFTKSTSESTEMLSIQLENDNFVENSCGGNCDVKSDKDTFGDQDVAINSFENKEIQRCENTVKKDLNVSKKENVIILMCPLCWKSFESKDSQITHMKTCALKNKVSTKQLLGALELLQRQEAERQALGLPLLSSKVPNKPKKDFSTSSIKPKTVSDGYLQLGLALSASLTEAEKEKERDYLLEAGLFEEAEEKALIPTQDVPEEFFAKPAPIFLNAGRRSGDEGRVMNKRRRVIKYGLGKNPTLLKRTEEERERLITEKVAIILVGDENGMPGKNESSGDPGKFHLVWETTSEELKMYVNKENVWWTLASVSPSSVSQNQYYVKDLSGLISPSKYAAGSKLMHLSQIPGRNHTPGKSLTIQMCGKESNDKSERNSPVLGIQELEPSTVVPSKKPVKRSLFDQVSKHFEQNTLSCDWEMLMGKSEMSDVTVYTQEDRRIPAHKLVFYVRCPSILKDIITEEIKGGKSSALLFWNDTCFHAAWEFLKYIYCGVCCDMSAMGVKVINEINELAEKYHAIELVRLLKETNSFSKANVNVLVRKTNPSNLRGVSFHTLNSREDSNLMKFEESDCEGNISSVKDHQVAPSGNPETKNVTKEPLLDKETCADGADDYVDLHDKFLNKSSFSPSVSVAGGSSPDIFHVSSLHSPDSPMSVMIIEERTECVERCDGNESSRESRASIDYLVSLMEKDTEDSGNTLQPHNSQDSNNSDEITVEEAIEISSVTATQNQCEDYEKTTTPDVLKTPSVNDKTCELIVYPTPVVSEKMSYRTCSQTITTAAESPCKDVKRKFVNLERSDASTPITKKLCITENTIDFTVKNSIVTDKEEVVDLTLSSPEGEERTGKLALNDSDVSTIPRSDNISHAGSLLGETTVPGDNLSIPDGMSYISNVWDDFDPVPEPGGYLAYGKSILDISSDSLKKAPVKTIANSENEIFAGNCYEKKSPVKDLNMSEEISKTSRSSSDNIDESLENDDGVAMSNSVMHDKIDLTNNDEYGCDITDNLLNSSLQRINSSIFWRDENEPVEVNNYNEGTSGSCQVPVCAHSGALCSKKNTPVNSTKYSSIHTANVTPIADYSAMKTPTLHKELDRYGIKHLKRNQAKKILRHIYNELHPVVSTGGETCGKMTNTADSGRINSQRLTEEQSTNKPQENINSNKERITFESLDSNSDEQSSEESSGSSSDSVILEESMYEKFESPVKDFTLSQKASTVDIPTAMKALIESNSTLHRKILIYEPIWLDEIKVALKENGAKFNANQLMNYLDEKCITFRLAQGNRHKRKRPAKKKNFSLSQPCNSKGGRSSSISSSQPC